MYLCQKFTWSSLISWRIQRRNKKRRVLRYKVTGREKILELVNGAARAGFYERKQICACVSPHQLHFPSSFYSFLNISLIVSKQSPGTEQDLLLSQSFIPALLLNVLLGKRGRVATLNPHTRSLGSGFAFAETVSWWGVCAGFIDHRH